MSQKYNSEVYILESKWIKMLSISKHILYKFVLNEKKPNSLIINSTMFFVKLLYNYFHSKSKILFFYFQALRLSRTALTEMKVGQIINLVSSDTTRTNLLFVHGHYVLWIGPLQTIVVTYFLWQEIGVSSLFGVASLLFFIPLQGL